MNVECLLRDSMKTKPKSNRGARQKTSTPKNVTRMNYNENPYGMSDEVKKAVTDASLNSYMYQDFYAVDLPNLFFIFSIFIYIIHLSYPIINSLPASMISSLSMISFL